MAVRNWWISGHIDGRKTEFSGGPRNKDGGFNLYITQRDEGSIISAGYIRGRVDALDNLVLEGSINGQSFQFVTKR